MFTNKASSFVTRLEHLLFRAFTNHRGAILLALLVALQLGIGFRLISDYRYQINPDGVSYLSIAEHYLGGRWGDALNTYWSPLLSWLLVPLLAVGVDGLLAGKILTVLTAGGMTVSAWWLFSRMTPSLMLRLLGSGVVACYALKWAMEVISPDLLVSTLVIWMLAVFLDPRFDDDPRSSLIPAVIGAVAYYAKGYALPFTLVILVLVHGYRFLRDRTQRRVWIHRLALSVGTLVLLVAPWVTLISLRAGHLTVSTAGAYSVGFMGPNNNQHHPMHVAGLIDPPNDAALSAWEDPSRLTPLFPAWHDSGWENVMHEWEVVTSNARRIWTDVSSWSIFVFTALLVGLFLILSPRTDVARRRQLALVFAAAIIYVSGYALLYYEERYIWVVLVLVIGVLLVVLEELLAVLRWHVVAVFALAALILIAIARPPYGSLLADRGRMRNVSELAIALAEEHVELRGQRIASLSKSQISWSSTLSLCWHMRCRYYGMVNEAGNSEGVLSQLIERDIRYILSWDDDDRAQTILADAYHEVMLSRSYSPLRIFVRR